MASEGMVHALELTRSLLNPGGLLIEIHPTAEPSPVILRGAGETELVGYLLETDQFIEYNQAEEALARVQMTGLFRLEQRLHFEFVIQADSYAELKDFLQSTWSDTLLLPEMEKRAATVAERMGQVYGVQLREMINMMGLRAL